MLFITGTPTLYSQPKMLSTTKVVIQIEDAHRFTDAHANFQMPKSIDRLIAQRKPSRQNT